MATTILIPTPLRPFTDKLDAVEIDGANIGELLTNLTTRYGGLKQHLYSADGKLRSFVNIYVNDDDIRYLQKEQTPLKSGDTVYNPIETKLLKQAKAAGAKTVGGVEMFVRQAARQFEAWTGKPAPLDLFRRVVESRLTG